MDAISLSRLFDESEKRFSITKTAFEKLKKSALSIGRYITNNEPTIDTYLQGSFSYGTIIRPYKGDSDGDYDIDLVVEFPTIYYVKGPEYVKSLVGDCLKKSNYKSHLDEGKRCWTLDYSDTADSEIAYHLDILPSVSNPVPTNDELRKTEIKITNHDKSGYSWSNSNPMGYRNWLSAIDKRHCNVFEPEPASNIGADLNRVANPFDSSPLRLAVKVLKRSRDVFFSGRSDADYAPISIILTTISAMILDEDKTKYNSVAPALGRIIGSLNTKGPEKNGSWRLLNPIDPKENFADKWNSDERYAKAYFAWCEYMQRLWAELESADETQAKQIMERMLGLRTNTLQNITVNKPKPIVTAPTTPKSYVKG